jgi:hypothetical protein
MDSGLSVSGFTGLQTKMLDFKAANKSAGQFYLAKLDISSCFDSIPHEKLFGLLAGILNEKEFLVRRVDQIQLDLINNRPIKRINRIARGNNIFYLCNMIYLFKMIYFFYFFFYLLSYLFISNFHLHLTVLFLLEANYNDFDFSGLNMNSASVTVDRVVGKFHSGQDIFRIIHEHLSNNIVQVLLG